MRSYYSGHIACVYNFEYIQISDMFIEGKCYKELAERSYWVCMRENVLVVFNSWV